MLHKFRNGKNLLFLPILLANIQIMHSSVTSIIGDTGTSQNGALTISGGTSGAVFDSTASIILQGFNFLSMPLTTSLTGQIIIGDAVILHNYGESQQNMFVGEASGNFSVTGDDNAGFGAFALNSVTEGDSNTALGSGSLANLTTGLGNVVVGTNAATGLIDGNNNILVGAGAGSAYASDESDNIIIGTANPGVVSESLTIRIGSGQTQQACYIDGIYGALSDSETSLPAYIDDQGKLGTIVSSAGAKEDICPLGIDVGLKLLKLKPVSFNLKADPKKIKQYGLIAEEVYQSFPELAVRDTNGSPYAVRYHQIPVLLIREMQRKEMQIQDLKKSLLNKDEQIQGLKKSVLSLEERVKKLEHFCR